MSECLVPQSHVCEKCNFHASSKWGFERHLKSKKHQERIIIDDASFVQLFTCNVCTKKYKCRTGLWRHSQTCKPTAVEPTSTTNTTELLDKINEIQTKLSTLSCASVTNNNTNNNNIHIYLNKHCNNAMNIEQFIESMHLNTDDLHEIDKHKFYYQGAIQIIKKYFQRLTPEERPMHCALPVINKPVSFFVRDENKWKEECQSMINYELKYIEEFENDEQQMSMTKFFEKFNEKLFDTYQELCNSDKKLHRINDKMIRGGGTKDKIDMLDQLVDSHLLVIDATATPINSVIT